MNKFATIVFKGVFYLSDKSGKKKGTNLPQQFLGIRSKKGNKLLLGA